jgi:hypothetical protein
VASTVLDVRDTFAPAHVRAPKAPAASTPTTVRRLPVAVLTAGALGITEAVGLLAAGLTSLDGVLTSASRPSGVVVALALIALAGWIVLAAAGGAALIDGTGKKLGLAVAYGELGLVGLLAVVAVGAPVQVPFGLPLPALLLLALAVPVGKLLLVGAPSAQAWIAAGPRTRERRPDPVAAHRGAATLTLAAIALGLVALTVATPVSEDGAGSPASSTVYQP